MANSLNNMMGHHGMTQMQMQQQQSYFMPQQTGSYQKKDDKKFNKWRAAIPHKKPYL